jgi:hypothetical protein
MDTPKHLMAMAASKKTAARGNVRFATAKNDERRCAVLRAHTERRYRPNAPRAPEKAQVSIPGMIPADAKAYTKDVSDTDFACRTSRRTLGKESMP